MRVEDASVVVHAFRPQIGPDIERDGGEADAIGKVLELTRLAVTDLTDHEGFVSADASSRIR